jgi:hypothetical protein
MLSPITLQTHLNKIWLALTRRSPHLLDLAAIQTTGRVVGAYYTGRQIVPLSQIRGSASSARCADFDANFQPLKAHLQTRWQGITAARRRGVKLPPVTLIRIGEVYFVEDGHHRISVAKAQGEQVIEAEVSIWQMAGLSER